MPKKRKEQFVPSGDDYADDPVVYRTRRKLTYETQRRHFQVRSARGGDPKRHMDRNFDPWFLEKVKPVDPEEGMKWKEILARRFKKGLMWVAASSFFDYVYLLSFLAALVMVPVFDDEEELKDNILNDASKYLCSRGEECARKACIVDELINLENGNVTYAEEDALLKAQEECVPPFIQYAELCAPKCVIFNFERYMLAFPPMVMVLSAFIPMFLALLIRVSMLKFLKDNSTVKSQRFWGLFFFVSMKVLHFEFDLRKLLPSFINKLIPKLRIPKKKAKVGPVGDAGEGNDGGASAAETDDAGDQGSGDIEAQTETVEEEEYEEEVEYEDDDEGESSEEEFEIGENEIAWNCRVCNEFNLQEKVQQQKSLKSRRLGTKENAENIRLVIHTVGKIHEHYVVEFKHLHHANHCRKCGVAADYKPQRCNEHSFYPLQDYHDQLHEPKHADPSANDGNIPDQPPGAPGRTGGRDSVLLFENKSIADALSSNNLTLLDKIRVMINKVRNAVRRFLDPEAKENQVLYNDHTFSQELKKFMPFVERRVLQKGQRYQIGERIEAIERRTMWYPGVIKRAVPNGTYDIIYDNGDIVETVLPVKVRYPQTYRPSRLARFTLFQLLIAFSVFPLPMISMYQGKEDEDIVNKNTFEMEELLISLCALYASTSFIAVFCSFTATFLRTAQAGIVVHFKLLLFAILPHLFAFAFCYIMREKMEEEKVLLDNPQAIIDEGDIKWYHASVAQLFFSLFMSMQWKAANSFAGKCCYYLTIPITAFSTIIALQKDGIIEIEDRTIVYAPSWLFALMLLSIRVLVPYFRSSIFYDEKDEWAGTASKVKSLAS